MAYQEKIEIDVVETGMDEVTDKANRLAEANRNVKESEDQKTEGMTGSAEAVLDNGGAMGLLNDATGGYAMMVKDAVEAAQLFTKSQKVAALVQSVLTFVMNGSTLATKAFRVALISTGIGAIVVALGMLIANFGAITDALMDFIGVSSEASKEAEKMAEASTKALKEQELQLELNGYKYDEYTRRKMKAEIDFNAKVKELSELDSSEISDEKRLQAMKDAREKMKFEIKQADTDSRAQLDKTLADWRKKQEDANADTNMKKIALEKKRALDEIALLKATETEKGELMMQINAYYSGEEKVEQKRLDDEAQKKRDEAAAKEKSRRESIKKILDDYRNKELDALAVDNKQKIQLEQDRAIKELEILGATKKEKERINKYYDNLRLEEDKRIAKERKEIEEGRFKTQKNLELDQRQWEVEHMTDPKEKIKAEKQLLIDKSQWEIGQLKKVAEDATLTEKERADAKNEIAAAQQELQQASLDYDLEQYDLENERENDRLAKKKARLDDLAEKRQKVDFAAIEWLDKVSHEGEQRTDEEIDRDRSVAQNKINVGMSATKTLLDLAGKGSELTKGMAAAQAIQDTYKGAVSSYTGMVQTIPGPVGIAAGAVAAAATAVMGFNNVKKILSTKNVEKSAPGGGAGGGAAANVPAAPAFNLVQGTGSNQIAEAVANSGQVPLQAYVVSNNVTTAQSLERNIVSESVI